MSDERSKGPLAWFARNRVAANLLFAFLIVAGSLSLLNIRLEVFPDIEPGIIFVRVPYPGGSPEQVDRGVVQRVIDKLANIEGVREIRGTAAENAGIVIVEAKPSVDVDRVLRDVKRNVDQITTFPEQAEEPIVRAAVDRIQVITIALHGDVPLKTLKEQAYRIEEDLEDSAAISIVEINGIPTYEVSIEVPEENLRRYNLTLPQIAQRVAAGSLDLPAGSIETGDREIRLRTDTQAYDGDAFRDVPVLERADGTVLRLRDIGQVIDGFADTDFSIRFDGERAVLIEVFRIGDEGALNVASTVAQYVRQQQANLPPGMTMVTYNDQSDSLRSRIVLLVKNGLIGLALVLLLLGTLLDFRLAFWAGAGLTMSFIGALIVLPATGTSINLISLFAFILVLGIVVDDAIVVGENIYRQLEMGKPGVQAAIDGVREVAVPVTLTILSTIIAFVPLLFSQGDIGQILRVIPIVVIAVLGISLVEALFVLPAHLSGTKPPSKRKRTIVKRYQETVQGWLDRFIRGPFARAIDLAIRWRYLTTALSLALLILTAGWFAGGFIQWRFFPEVDANLMSAGVEMPPGTSEQQTRAVIDRIAAASLQLPEVLADRRPEDAKPLIEHVQKTVGGQPFAQQQAEAGNRLEISNPRFGEVVVALLDTDLRAIGTAEVVDAWRDLVGEVPGARVLSFTSSVITAGSPISVQLSIANETQFGQVQAAADDLKRRLRQFEGVTEITDDFQRGQPQVVVEGVTPLGLSLGLDALTIAQQQRAAFFGFEAQRFQRENEEVRVYVRLPERQRLSLRDLKDLYIRTPQNSRAPFELVADYTLEPGFARINRINNDRVITVTADVDVDVANAQNINQQLGSTILPDLQQSYPGLQFEFGGEQEEQQRSLRSLGTALLVAIVGIYFILAVQFRSYIQPMLVMIAIPFGVMGAVWGHMLLGKPLTFLSMFGIVALTGVVVNDSLILIDLVNKFRREGVPLGEAIRRGALQRTRPIFLTSMTTFFGLTPIILEQSLQAQFLIPMALSLGFGVLIATPVTLLLVPAMYRIVEDARGWLVPRIGAMARFERPEAEPVPAQ